MQIHLFLYLLISGNKFNIASYRIALVHFGHIVDIEYSNWIIDNHVLHIIIIAIWHFHAHIDICTHIAPALSLLLSFFFSIIDDMHCNRMSNPSLFQCFSGEMVSSWHRMSILTGMNFSIWKRDCDCFITFFLNAIII